VAGGLVTWAECGGLLWLCRRLDGTPMVGAIPAEARMTERLTIGYRSAVTRVVSPLGALGVDLRGHEFHRTVAEPAGDALALTGRFGESRAGFASPTMFASYLHQHIATSPAIAERFVAAAAGQGLRATQPTI
jgi:cobyrinic acid a,c-diamide synthase